MRSSQAVRIYILRLSLFLKYLMPSLRSTRQCRFNRCCCCNPFVICSSMLGLPRNPLCRSSLARCIAIAYLTITAARKPSNSSNTTIPLNKDTEEGKRSKAMADDTPAVNGSQSHDNFNVDKPAVIAKEPKVSKPMVYESSPSKEPDGLSNGTTNHASQSMTQRKTVHLLKLFILIADQDFTSQALEPIRVPPKAGAIPVSCSQKTSRSQSFKRRSSKPDESLSQISIGLIIPTFIA